MARRHGSKGQVKLQGVVLASIKSWKLDMKRDRVDVTCFGDANKVYVQGLKDISGTFAGCYDFNSSSPSNGNSALFDAADGDVAVDLDLIPTTLDPANFWEGPAFLDGNVEVDVAGAVLIGATFVASDAWSRQGV